MCLVTRIVPGIVTFRVCPQDGIFQIFPHLPDLSFVTQKLEIPIFPGPFLHPDTIAVQLDQRMVFGSSTANLFGTIGQMAVVFPLHALDNIGDVLVGHPGVNPIGGLVNVPVMPHPAIGIRHHDHRPGQQFQRSGNEI